MELQHDDSTRFDGNDYDHSRDFNRLDGQIGDIFALMKDGQWRSLAAIEDLTGHPQSSISAQLRNLRKAKFGSYIIDREHIQNDLYVYRIAGKDTGKPCVVKKAVNPDSNPALQMCQMLWDAMRLKQDGSAQIDLMPLDLVVLEKLATRAGINKGE